MIINSCIECVGAFVALLF